MALTVAPNGAAAAATLTSPITAPASASPAEMGDAHRTAMARLFRDVAAFDGGTLDAAPRLRQWLHRRKLVVTLEEAVEATRRCVGAVEPAPPYEQLARAALAQVDVTAAAPSLVEEARHAAFARRLEWLAAHVRVYSCQQVEHVFTLHPPPCAATHSTWSAPAGYSSSWEVAPSVSAMRGAVPGAVPSAGPTDGFSAPGAAATHRSLALTPSTHGHAVGAAPIVRVLAARWALDGSDAVVLSNEAASSSCVLASLAHALDALVAVHRAAAQDGTQEDLAVQPGERPRVLPSTLSQPRAMDEGNPTPPHPDPGASMPHDVDATEGMGAGEGSPGTTGGGNQLTTPSPDKAEDGSVMGHLASELLQSLRAHEAQQRGEFECPAAPSQSQGGSSEAAAAVPSPLRTSGPSGGSPDGPWSSPPCRGVAPHGEEPKLPSERARPTQSDNGPAPSSIQVTAAAGEVRVRCFLSIGRY